MILRLLVLLAFIVNYSGIPVIQIAEEAGESAYPCQHHGCGCTTAEQCWKSCCCFTLGERLAWAEQHHVEVPSDAAESKTCCTQHAASDFGSEPDSDSPTESTRVRWVLTIAAMKCRGQSTNWMGGAPPVLPGSGQFSARIDVPPTGTITIHDDVLESRSIEPPTSFG